MPISLRSSVAWARAIAGKDRVQVGLGGLVLASAEAMLSV